MASTRRSAEDRLFVAVLVVAVTTLGAASVATALVLGGCGRACGATPGAGSALVAVAAPVAVPVAPVAPAAPVAPGPGTRDADGAGGGPGPALAARITRAVLGAGAATVRVRLGGTRAVDAAGVVRWSTRPGAPDRDPELSLALGVGPDRIRLVRAGGRVHVAPPRPVGGRSWISMPPTRPLPLLDAWGSAVADVGDAVAPWRTGWVAATVQTRGGAVVDGVPTRRFVVRFPSASASATEVDLDAHDLPVRIRTPGGTDVAYAGWGAAVRVEPPAAVDVVQARSTTG